MGRIEGKVEGKLRNRKQIWKLHGHSGIFFSNEGPEVEESMKVVA